MRDFAHDAHLAFPIPRVVAGPGGGLASVLLASAHVPVTGDNRGSGLGDQLSLDENRILDGGMGPGLELRGWAVLEAKPAEEVHG